MNEFRAALNEGQAAQQLQKQPTLERCRRLSSAAELSGKMVVRVEKRYADQRIEPRYRGAVERATLFHRRKATLVKVVNLSSSGAMIEARTKLLIGDKVSLKLQGGEPVPGRVCWLAGGRIGLEFAEGTFILP